MELDLLGIREGTDKSSLTGDYLRHYERILGPLRDAEFNLIEIGVFRGASTRMWPQFLSRARIIGVDIDPACRRYADQRVAIEIGSQNDPTFLHAIAATYPPRVIIDDGSHTSYDVIFSFERLFPALLAGGIYIIEDLHFHLQEGEAERLRNGSSILAHDYVADLARERLGSEEHLRRISGLRGYLLRAIDRIELFGQCAVIHKKAEPQGLSHLLALYPHVEASRSWLNWLTYSQHLLRAGAESNLVVDALRRSLELDSTLLITWERLSEALERSGDISGAIAALVSASKLRGLSTGQSESLAHRIKRLESLASG